MCFSIQVCTFYQKGSCAYGSRCRYDHVKTKPLAPASSSSTDLPLTVVNVSGTVTNGSAQFSPYDGTDVHSPFHETAQSIPSSGPPHAHTAPSWGENSAYYDVQETEGVGYARSINPADQPICSFAAAGDCPHNNDCPHIHGDLCASCGKHCLHPFRPEEREEHIKTCEKRQKHLKALRQSQEIECNVCLERVLSKSVQAERKFGILSECDHAFCISCIRNWRSSSPASGFDVNSALRACPICRKLSYFVIPSVIWYSVKEEKQEIVDSYKAKLRLFCISVFLRLNFCVFSYCSSFFRSIDCKHFDFGNGSCPFGTSCFYRVKLLCRYKL